MIKMEEVIDTTKTSTKAVNLLALYNENKEAEEQLEADEALLNPDFIRFASYMISLYKDRMSKISLV